MDTRRNQVTPQEWAGLAVAITTIVTAYVGSIRWLVKHYLSELHRNGGSSLRDSVDRLEDQVEQIMIILMSQNARPKRKVTPKE
jgi:hypothetical protein